MFRPARQCMPRWMMRLLILFLVMVAIGWVGLSQTDTTSTLGCDSSKQCYESFVNTAKRIALAPKEQGLFLQQQQSMSDMAEPSSSSSIPLPSGNDEQAVSHSSSLDTKDEQVTIVKNLTPQEQEYQRLTDPSQGRIKAAFVTLARNREVHAMRSSMRYLEDRFNHKYNYPWIFLNEEPFSEEFINLTRQMTNAETYYGQVPAEHWSYPDWIDQNLATECRERMASQGIVYGGSESYRHMCRYQSGFFYMHPLLDGLDYYWRVEPGVKFSCDIDYDPFRLMQERDLKYGFTIALQEYLLTIPTLWERTLEFVRDNPQYIYPRTRPDSLYNMITEDDGLSYNLCHFWSNFEIGSIKFLRSEGYQAYFNHLDRAGGFFYERWGDAPVHSIAVALMLSAKEVHWFYDIGYKHDNFEHCPTEPDWLVHGKCYCDPGTSFDYVPGSCINRYLEVTNTTVHNHIITQPDEGDL